MPANKLLKADQLSQLAVGGATKTLVENTVAAPEHSNRDTNGSGPQSRDGDFGSTCKFSTSNAG